MPEFKLVDAVKRSSGVKFPFSIKLVLIVTAIILNSIWIITVLMTLLVSSEFIRTAEETNFAVNKRAAAGIEERMYRLRSEALFLLDIITDMSENDPGDSKLINTFFERNPNIAGIIIPGHKHILNQHFLINNNIPMDALNLWLMNQSTTVDLAKQNEPVILNASPAMGKNILALFFPWQNTGFEDVAVIFFSPQNLVEIAGSGYSSTIFVNSDGDILISPDFNKVLLGLNISNYPFFEALKNNSDDSINIRYSQGGDSFIAAGHLVTLADSAVFSTLELSIVTKHAVVILRRNILLSIMVLFLSILVTWFFSKSVTTPIKKFISFANQIELGQFEHDFSIKSNDEFGLLSRGFTDMGHRLSQREKARDLVGRYNNLEIENKAFQGELNLKGELLKAVILSIDLISLSDIVSALNAEESMEFINSIMTKITTSIEKNGGMVDRLAGSRVIGIWGIHSPSEDMSIYAINSIRSALYIRKIIFDINTGRGKSNAPLLRMASGIHFGSVLAGSINVSKYNYFTVFGKSLDEAAWCGEAAILAKTDIVISGEIHKLAGSRILTEDLSNQKYARGKMGIFGLVNLTPTIGQEKQNWPYTLKDVRDMLGFYDSNIKIAKTNFESME